MSDGSKRWAIRHQGLTLDFWSNSYGWVAWERCSHYSDSERAGMSLPVDGQWVCELGAEPAQAEHYPGELNYDQCIVLCGNPVDGLDAYGPFDTADDANDFADTKLGRDDEWWVMPVTPVQCNEDGRWVFYNPPLERSSVF